MAWHSHCVCSAMPHAAAQAKTEAMETKLIKLQVRVLSVPTYCGWVPVVPVWVPVHCVRQVAHWAVLAMAVSLLASR